MNDLTRVLNDRNGPPRRYWRIGTSGDDANYWELFRYLPGFAGTKTPPRPRPDYVISRGRKVVAIADAKYRDLWQHDLPGGNAVSVERLCALSQANCTSAAILYPSSSPAAREIRLAISDPADGGARGLVCLRPVHIGKLLKLITSSVADSRHARYAHYLVFGTQDRSQATAVS